MASIQDHFVERNERGLSVRLNLDGPATLGCHWIDPRTGKYLRESPWIETSDGAAALQLHLPAVPGLYRFYVSPREDSGAWAYAEGKQFLLIDVDVSPSGIGEPAHRLARLAQLNRTNWPSRLMRLLAEPFQLASRHAPLIFSLVQRDILARYRGSIADAFWAILNPLVLMLTYYFIFGIVLETRFPGDPSRHGFILYFLAGMLPWLAFSEALARASNLARENRNLITKLIFPIEVLPLNLTLAGLVTGLTAFCIFLGFLLFARGSVPASALYLPLVLLPQFFFTAGLCYLLCAAGVFFRDLVYIVSLALTLWFFLTPICYPDTSLPVSLLPVLGKNPIYIFVRAYRAILVEGHAPEWPALAKLSALSVLVFYLGYGYFARVKKSFADVL